MDMTVKIEVDNTLVSALNNIAEALKTGKNASAGSTYTDAVQPVPATPVQPVPAAPVLATPVQPVAAAPVPPVTTVPVTPAPPVPAAPAQPVAAPAVPTAAPIYTIDMIANAGAVLVDAGKMDQLYGLLAKFGIQSIQELNPADYGTFAGELRALGARI